MEVAASGNPGVPPLEGEFSSLLAAGSGGFSSLVAIGSGRSASGCLLGELCTEDSPGISNIGFNKSSSISSVMLGPVTTSLGHSVMECGEETGVNDYRGMAPGESP